MNRTIYISLASAITTCTLVGAFFVQPPQAAARGSIPNVDAALPAPELRPLAASRSLLCGLSLGDVADIVDYYDFDPDMQVLADALSTPFDCSAYGSLCSELTGAEAYQLVCGAWDDMRLAAPISTIVGNINVRLEDFGVGECQPAPQNCAIICGMDPVVYCTGWSFNGHCYPTPNCGNGGPDRGLGFPHVDQVLEQ